MIVLLGMRQCPREMVVRSAARSIEVLYARYARHGTVTALEGNYHTKTGLSVVILKSTSCISESIDTCKIKC